MSFRSNREKFGAISPWLQGCPPNLAMQQHLQQSNMMGNGGGDRPMQAFRGMMNNTPPMNQNLNSNHLVNQLTLANSLLSTAFGQKQHHPQPLAQANNMFGNMQKNSGRNPFGNVQRGSLLGNPPLNLNFTTSMTGQKAITTHVNMIGNNMNEAKRMRYGGNQPQRNNNNHHGRNQFHNNRNNDNKPFQGNSGSQSRNNDNKPFQGNPGRFRKDQPKALEKRENRSTSRTRSVTEAGDKARDKDKKPEDKDKGDEVPATEENVKAGQKRPRSASPAEVPESTLQVTIQQGSKGRSVSKDGETGSGTSLKGPFFCHACNVSFSTQENFHRHMNSRSHKMKMDSLITLHEVKTKQFEAEMKANEHLRRADDDESESTGRGNYCAICKTTFTGPRIGHLQSKAHKACEESNQKKGSEEVEDEECTKDGEEIPAESVAEETTEVPDDKVVEATAAAAEDVQEGDLDVEMKSDKADNDNNDDLPPKEVPAEATAVVAEEMPEKSTDDTSEKQTAMEEETEPSVKATDECASNLNSEDLVQENPKTNKAPVLELYNPDVEVGEDYIFPLSGLFCKLCRKFYRDKDTAKAHCRTAVHYDNYMANKKNAKVKPVEIAKPTKDQPAKKSPKSSASKNAPVKKEPGEIAPADGDAEGKQDLPDDQALSDSELFSVGSSQSDKNEESSSCLKVKQEKVSPKKSPVKRNTRRTKNP